jgi:hypothetical protein
MIYYVDTRKVTVLGASGQVAPGARAFTVRQRSASNCSTVLPLALDDNVTVPPPAAPAGCQPPSPAARGWQSRGIEPAPLSPAAASTSRCLHYLLRRPPGTNKSVCTR